MVSRRILSWKSVSHFIRFGSVGTLLNSKGISLSYEFILVFDYVSKELILCYVKVIVFLVSVVNVMAIVSPEFRDMDKNISLS